MYFIGHKFSIKQYVWSKSGPVKTVVASRPWCLERLASRRQLDTRQPIHTQVSAAQVDTSADLHSTADTELSDTLPRETVVNTSDRVTLGVIYGVPAHISTDQLAAENHCQWARCITQQVTAARATEAHSTSTTDQVDVYTALLAFTADRPQSITCCTVVLAKL